MVVSYTIQVSKFTNLAPNWWVNFLKTLPSTKGNFAFHVLINENLKKWNAVYLDKSVETPIVIFETEKDATMFILSWS